MKKGELTTRQLVILIVLIVSFIVVLFFLFRLNLGKEADKEICHNSVIARGSSVISANSIPLNCHRAYVCITEDGTCEQMTKPEIKKVESQEDVFEVLAKDMADCWWMFGEGQVNYIEGSMFSNLYCSICSQIAFDDSVKKIFDDESNFDKELLYDYLVNNEVEKDKSYAEYLYKTEKLDVISGGKEFGGINLDKQYYSMMGITSKVSKLKWAVAGAVAGAAILFNPFTTVGVVTGIVSSAGGAAAGAFLIAPVVEGESGNEYISPSLIEANSEEFEALECKDIVTMS